MSPQRSSCLLSFFISRPCRHPEHRLGRGPNPLQQHLAGITLVKSTAGSYSKTESAIVNKAVSDFANELLEARRTSLRPTIPPEGMKKNILPILRRVPLSAPVTSLNNVLMKPLTRNLLLMKKNPPTTKTLPMSKSLMVPTPIGDQRWRVKETFREQFATAAYQASS